MMLSIPNLTSLLVLANLLVIVGGIVTSWVVVRSSIAKGTQEIQNRVTLALKDENEILQNRLNRVEADNQLLHFQQDLIIEMMKSQLGIVVEVDGRFVHMKNAKGITTTTYGAQAALKKHPMHSLKEEEETI